MPNFVTDNNDLNFPKVDRRAIPPGESETKFIRAEDWNELCQGAEDVRDWIRAGTWYGLTAQAADPAPSGITSYVWLKTDGTLWRTVSGTATEIVVKNSSGQISTASADVQAIRAPDGGVYAKTGYFGYNGDESLNVIGTTNLEVLRLGGQHNVADSNSAIHNYSNASLDRSSDIRLNPTADHDLTGIEGAGDNFRLMCIQNRSSAYTVNIRSHNTGSTAGNRFHMPGSFDNWGLEPGAKAMFAHDATDDSWKLLGWGSTRWPRLKVGRFDGTVQTVTTTGAAKITLNDNTSVVRFTPASTLEITGFTGGADGRVILLHNHGTANILLYEELDGTAADRIKADLGGGFGYLVPKSMALMYYDGTASRWVLSFMPAQQSPSAVVVNGNFTALSACGFQGSAAIGKPTVTGSRGGNAALQSVLTALANYGLITDSTS